MADWQEQLNSILSDPDAMAQIVSLAQSISGGPEGAPPIPGGATMKGAADPPDGAAMQDAASRDGAPKGGAPFDPDAVGATLRGLDPELMRRLMPLLRQMNRPESSETTAFLLALRPFLSEARRGKVERAAQLARLIHLGKTFLTTQGQEGAGYV